MAEEVVAQLIEVMEEAIVEAEVVEGVLLEAEAAVAATAAEEAAVAVLLEEEVEVVVAAVDQEAAEEIENLNNKLNKKSES